MPAPATRYALVCGVMDTCVARIRYELFATCYAQNFREFFWWERSA
jgi:hypothetical protein